MGGISAERLLHSRVDPSGEALRFLDRSLSGRRPSCLLVLGGGEDWLSQLARDRLPGSLILSLQFDPSCRGRERPGADLRWYPDEGTDLSALLYAAVPDRLDGGIAVLSWKPSERAFPDSAALVFRVVRRTLEELTSDAATTRYWSRRWMKNALTNFLDTDRYLDPPRGSPPIVVAAAGPSLDQALAALRPFRNRIRLWALSSASGACLRAGWRPELIACTDPGFWADRHFDALLRESPENPPPLAAHLTSRIPPRARALFPRVLLSPPETPESDLAAAAGLPILTVPARGTAAGDTLALARASTRGAVIAAGLDLGSRDLRSHCRPYGFDSQVLRPEGRLRPGLSLVWERETAAFPVRFEGWRRGRSFDLYAAGLCTDPEGAIRRFLPSPIPVEGTVPLVPEDLETLLAGDLQQPETRAEGMEAPGRTRRAALALAILKSWEAEAETAVSGSAGTPLSSRSRRLLYALGGSEAAAFLAEAARGVREEDQARRARAAVRRSVLELGKLAV